MDIQTLKFNEALVFEVDGHKVKLTLLPNKDAPEEFAFGIDAPRAIAINREEIYQKKRSRKEKL